MLSQGKQYAIGVDLGGTKIQVGIVDEAGKIYDYQRFDTPVDRGPIAIEEQILKVVNHLQKKNGISPLGIGFGLLDKFTLRRELCFSLPILNGMIFL